MLLRRNTALALGALVLTVPVLSSCGFNYATDRVNTIAHGANDRTGQVDVLGAVIVSQQDGSGTFLATLASSDQAEETEFDSLSGGEGATLTAAEFEPYPIAARSGVALLQEGGVRVEGDFEIGDFVPVTVGFSNGDSVTLPSVPVVPACDEYEGLDDAPQAEGQGAGAEESAGAAEGAEVYECEMVEHESGH